MATLIVCLITLSLLGWVCTRRPLQPDRRKLPSRLEDINSAIRAHIELYNAQYTINKIEGTLSQHHFCWQYKALAPTETSSALIDGASLPFALGTLQIKTNTQTSQRLCWHTNVHKSSTRPSNICFEDAFDAIFNATSDAETQLAAFGLEQRQMMLNTKQMIRSAEYDRGDLLITFELYTDTLPQNMAEVIKTWCELHKYWTMPHHIPGRLASALFEESTPHIAQNILKVILGHHKTTAAGQDVIKWTLQQDRPLLHATLATMEHHRLEHDTTLRNHLIAHAINTELSPACRKQCMDNLFRHCKNEPAVQYTLTHLGLTERHLDIRARALSLALRLKRPVQDQAILILSARHLINQRTLDKTHRQQLKTQLKYQRAHTTQKTHIELATKHVDHTMRYASLCVLEHRHMTDSTTVLTLIQCATFETHDLTRQFAFDALRNHLSTCKQLIQTIQCDQTIHPLMRALCAILTQSSHHFGALFRLEHHVQIKCQLLHHLRTHPHPALNAPQLFSHWMTLNHRTHCLEHMVAPGLLTRHQSLLQTASTCHPDAAREIIEAIEHHGPHYHQPARKTAQQLILNVLQMQNSLQLKQVAIRTLPMFANKDAILPLMSTIKVLQHASKRTPLLTSLCQDIQTLINQLTLRSKRLDGALSISSTQDTLGALSVSSKKGALEAV